MSQIRKLNSTPCVSTGLFGKVNVSLKTKRNTHLTQEQGTRKLFRNGRGQAPGREISNVSSAPAPGLVIATQRPVNNAGYAAGRTERLTQRKEALSLKRSRAVSSRTTAKRSRRQLFVHEASQAALKPATNVQYDSRNNQRTKRLANNATRKTRSYRDFFPREPEKRGVP